MRFPLSVIAVALAIGASLQLTGHAQQSLEAMIENAAALAARGEYADAAAAAESAIAAANTSGRPRQSLEATLVLVNAKFFQSRLTEGAQLADRAIEAATALGDGDLLARARNMRGVLARESGEFEPAITLMSLALEHYRAVRNQLEQVRLLRNIAGIYWELGELGSAEALLSDALRLSQSIHNRRFEAAVLEAQGIWAFQSGRPLVALEILARARALAEELHEDVLSDEITANIGDAQLRAGQFTEAVATFQALLDSGHFDKIPSLRALSLADLGYGLARLGRTDEGIALMREGLAIFSDAGAAAYLSVVITVQHRLGAVLREGQQNEEALLTYRTAIALVDRMRRGASIGATTSASVIASRNDLVTETIDLLVEMNQWDEAFLVAEQHRARTFLDAVGARAAAAAVSPDQLRLRDQLLQRASTLQTALWAARTTAQGRAELDRQIADVDRELERLSPAIVGAAAPVARDRVQRETLRDGAVLIEYALGERRSFAWALSRTGVTTALLPARAEVEAAVSKYRDLIAHPVSPLTARQAARDYQAAAARLHATLLAPIEPMLRNMREVIIVPDGALAYLPFETLPVSRQPGAPAMLERYQVRYAPSASSLGQLQAATPRRDARSGDLFAVGDPTVHDPEAASPTRSRAITRALNLGVTLTPLSFARDEVNGIARLFPASRRTVLVGAEGRENRVKRVDLSRFRYLHFAAHGLLDATSPSRSGIVLGSDPASSDDGVLQVREVVTLQLRADVVTLSACETGLGRLINGEGVVGIARAFLQAGAGGVAVSLWNVNDAATAELMQQFYRGLRDNLSPDAALRQAKLTLVRGARAAWRHPYFWAPFIYIGG